MSTGLRCQAAYCRYLTTHNTSDHRCGRCWAFGHGEAECDYWARKRDLATLAASQSPQANKTCNVLGCRRPYTHTTSAHHCPRCRKMCDGSHVCPISTVYQALLPTSDLSRAFDVLASASSTNNAAYTTISVLNASGVSEDVYVRTHGLHREVESLTVHPASASPSAANLRDWFIMDRHYISPPESPSPAFSPPESQVSVSSFVGSPSPIFTCGGEPCPVCREPVSRSSGVVEVYGATLDGKCTVCLDNPITHVFTACGHAVVCDECAKHWK